MTRGGWLKPILLATAAAFAVGALGGLMTDVGPWYRSLAQPAWKPPDWLFGPAWTVIYAFVVSSAVLAWRHAPDRASREWLLALFALNAFLNVLWSLLFFRLRHPDWSLIEIFPLWFSILLLMVVQWRYSPAAALLLLPYLGWVAFAGTLNWATVRLNGPF